MSNVNFEGTYGVFIRVGGQQNYEFVNQNNATEDLCTDPLVFDGRGVELDPHITIHMGLPNDIEKVKEICSKTQAFCVRLHGHTAFKSRNVTLGDGQPHSWDVLVRNVSSFRNKNDTCEPLVELHKALCEAFNKPWHRPEGYHPHLTIAYMKEGRASQSKYADALQGSSTVALVGEVVFKKYKDPDSEVRIPLIQQFDSLELSR